MATIKRGSQIAKTDSFVYNNGRENLRCELFLDIEADAVDFRLKGPAASHRFTIITDRTKRLYEASPQLLCRRQARIASAVLPLAFAFECPRLDRVIRNVVSGTGRDSRRVTRRKNTPVGTCDIRIGSELFQPDCATLRLLEVGEEPFHITLMLFNSVVF